MVICGVVPCAMADGGTGLRAGDVAADAGGGVGDGSGVGDGGGLGGVGGRQRRGVWPIGVRRWWRRAQGWALPAVVLVALSVPKLGQGAFVVDTGWYSAISLQAYRLASGGDFGALWTLMGPMGEGASSAYFNKPPLVFWLHGLVLWLFGPELWAARLPSVAAAAGCCVAVAWCARLGGMSRTGSAWAGVVLALTMEFSRHARAFSLDLWLVLFVLLGVGALLRGWAGCKGTAVGEAGGFDGRWGRDVGGGWLRWAVLAGAMFGLGLLVKPFVSLIGLLVLVVWGLAASADGAARRAVVRSGLVALASAVVVALPWHVSMVVMHGDVFVDQYLGREVLGRMSTASAEAALSEVNEDVGNPLYYVQLVGRSYWPWLVAVMLGLICWIGLLRRKEGLRVGLASPAGLCVVWIVVWMLMLSLFGDKRPRYMLMVYPFGAWLSAWWMFGGGVVGGGGWRGVVHAWGRGITRWVGVVVVVGAAVMTVVPMRVHRPLGESWTALFAWVREQGEPKLWQGGFSGDKGANLYLEFGVWPEPTHDGLGRRIQDPPAGALLLYHERDALLPGENEVVVFERGEVRATRLGEGGWMPVSK